MTDGGDNSIQQRDLWNDEAKTFDLAADHGLLSADVRTAWRELLLQQLPAHPARVLDLGCGTGTLTVLLAEQAYQVDGIDFSPEMIRLASEKAAGLDGVTLQVADAYHPPVARGTYDVVLSRHVLWAMPDPAVALTNWTQLLTGNGVLLLIEGRWSNNVGLSAEEVVGLVRATGRSADLTRLIDSVYWGRPITDDRFLVASRGQPKR